MSEVSDETLQHHNKDVFLYSICHLFSRIVLKKISPNQLCEFRNVERNHNKVIKINADINYHEKYSFFLHFFRLKKKQKN